jgi:hypothetical protein
MRGLLMRTLATSACMFLTLGLAAKARDGRVVETVYYPTSSSVLAVPTSYYLPASYSYYTPTVYTDVTPTSYVATSAYYTPTYYYAPAYYYTPTYYRSRSPRRARISYNWSPTTYYWTPTVYDVVATSYEVVSNSPSDCCPTAATAYPPASNGSTKGTGNGTGAAPMTSTPRGDGSEPGLLNTKPLGDQNKGVPINNEDAIKDKDKDKDKEQASPPVVPPPGDNGLGANAGGVQRRDALKPKPGERLMQQAASVKPLLQGKVTAGVTAAPVPNAKVVLSNPSGRFEKKTFTTDTNGLFEIRYLPEGDWSVEVEDAMGKAQPYGTLTVSAGRVTDSDGTPWSSLNLWTK